MSKSNFVGRHPERSPASSKKTPRRSEEPALSKRSASKGSPAYLAWRVSQSAPRPLFEPHPQEDRMQHSKELRFGSLLSLVSTLLFSAMLVAQTGTASKDSSSNPVKQRLEQILAHAGQTPAGVEAPPLPARLDPSRDA